MNYKLRKAISMMVIFVVFVVGFASLLKKPRLMRARQRQIFLQAIEAMLFRVGIHSGVLPKRIFRRMKKTLVHL